MHRRLRPTGTPEHRFAVALLLAFVSGAAVANVYYAQPLLDDLGAQLQMSPAALGWVTTATQGGYLLGLVMVVLGDRFDRRRIILVQLVVTAIGLLGAASAPSAWTFLFFSAFFGAASTVVQVITAFAAAASPPGRRGRTVGVVTSGVVLGILLARTVSGFIATSGGGARCSASPRWSCSASPRGWSWCYRATPSRRTSCRTVTPWHRWSC